MKNKQSVVTILLILLALGIMVYSLFFEEHEVGRFDAGTATVVSGDEYIESIESGQLLIRGADGKLYDAKSLRPKAVEIDDCPT